MTQKDDKIPEEFQKKVSRDKKIILGATIIVVILIILFIVSKPYDDYSDSIYNIDDYPDMTYGSNIAIEITEGHQDSNGNYTVYGKITPKSVDTDNYMAIATFYDSSGDEINSCITYLNDDNGEIDLGQIDLEGYELDKVEIGLIDDENNLVSRTTYYA